MRRGSRNAAISSSMSAGLVGAQGLLGSTVPHTRRGCLAALTVPLVELREEEAQHGGLQLVEARVVADELERLLVLEPWKRSMRTRSASSASVNVKRPPSPRPKRFLVGKKLKVRRRRWCHAAGPERLRGILDQRRAERRERVERGGPAEQVHGHDRLRPRRDPARDVLGVEVERDRVDVGEDRRRTAPGNRLGRGVEGERRADDLVAGADAHGVEHDHDRVRAVGDADRFRDAEVAAASSSKALTFGPRMKTPESTTSAIRASTSSRSAANCARTSTNGTGTARRV